MNEIMNAHLSGLKIEFTEMRIPHTYKRVTKKHLFNFQENKYRVIKEGYAFLFENNLIGTTYPTLKELEKTITSALANYKIIKIEVIK